MHKVHVRETVQGIAFNRKNGIICYPASKKDFMKGWYKNKWFYGKNLKAVQENRSKYLEEMSSYTEWFLQAYTPQSTDIEINTFADFYQIHFMHYLLCDRIVVEMGGKHDPSFGNFAPYLKWVDIIWKQTRTICEHYRIDWIQFTENAVLYNA